MKRTSGMEKIMKNAAVNNATSKDYYVKFIEPLKSTNLINSPTKKFDPDNYRDVRSGLH
jgi:hypothetical protein